MYSNMPYTCAPPTHIPHESIAPGYVKGVKNDGWVAAYRSRRGGGGAGLFGTAAMTSCCHWLRDSRANLLERDVSEVKLVNQTMDLGREYNIGNLFIISFCIL